MLSEYKSNFEEIRKLGSGGFSDVFEVKSFKDGNKYAIKKIAFKEEDLGETLNEIIFFGELESDFIVRYYHSWVENNDNLLLKPEKPLILHIQMELCLMTLNVFIESINDSKNSLNANHYSIACELFIQILECVHYLHSHNPQIIHRDLKPQNILLTNGDNNRCVKLTDFGLSVFHEFESQSHTSQIGTPFFKAPEVINRQYSTKADIYSLGRIMEQIFNIDVNRESLMNEIEIHLKYEKVKSYCIRCLSAIANQRPNCDEILKNRKEWEFTRYYYTNDLFFKINELIQIKELSELSMTSRQITTSKLLNEFSFNYEMWPLIKNIKLEFLKNCKYMSVIEEIEEKAIFIGKDKNVYALRVSEHIDSTIQEPIIINELTNKEIQRIVCGECHVLCLTKDKQIYSFGDNKFCQLGNGTNISDNKPTVISELNDKNIIEIKCGSAHSLALNEPGNLFVWGGGWNGQCGNGFKYNTLTPLDINFPENFVSISCGYNHCFALSKSGKLYGWGENHGGQLGIGNNDNQNKPILISFDDNITIKKISCGYAHSLVLTFDNEIYSFGLNSCGELGIGNKINQNKPIKIETSIKFIDIESTIFHQTSVGLSFDNKYYFWGNCNDKAITTPKISNFNSFNETFFYCSKNNIFLEVLNHQIFDKLLNIVRIKESKAILVTNDDMVYLFRLNESIDRSSQEPVIVNELSNKKIKSIICGLSHVLCLTENNSVYSFGDNSSGQLGNGSDISNYKPIIIKDLENEKIIEISCGFNHCLALSENGKLFVWGNGGYGQIGNNDINHQLSPIKIKSFDSMKIISISCGSHHCLALSSNNVLFGWGYNDFGQLGIGNNNNQLIPIRINNYDNIIINKISCGCNHNLLLTNENEIYSFGYNGFGELGIGNRNIQNKMIKLLTKIKFADIYSTCFDSISAGLSQTGKYYFWGYCGDEVITTPRESNFTSFDEIFTKFSKTRCTTKQKSLNKK